MFETGIFGPCLVWKLNWGCHGPPGPPSGYAPANADLKICWYLRLRMKIICQRFRAVKPFTFWDMHTCICEMFVQFVIFNPCMEFSSISPWSMRNPVELNSLFIKFFCYINWFDETQTRPLRQIISFLRSNSLLAV